MNVDTAVKLINESLVYKPGWYIHAEDFTSRHESAVCIHISYPGRETNRDHAPEFAEHNVPKATSILLVGDLSMEEFYRQLFELIMRFETHESREFFRIGPTMWAPFHPHHIDGIRRWGTPDYDLTFGFNSMKFRD